MAPGSSRLAVLFAAYFLDELGCRSAVNVPDELHSPAPGLHQILSHNLFSSPIFPFDQHIGTDLLDEVCRGILSEDYHVVNEGKR